MTEFPNYKITIEVLVCVFLGVISCRADVPEPDTVEEGPGEPPTCSIFADLIATYTMGGDPDNGIVAQAALGAPDNSTIPMELDTVLTVGFLGLGAITDRPGNDIRIHNSSETNARISVFCGDNQDDIPYCGEISPSNTDIDISQGSRNSVIFVSLVGLGGRSEIDAFEALQTVCILDREPEPPN